MKSIVIQIFLIFMPWQVRKFFLRLMGYKIYGDARIGFSIIAVDELIMAPGARIGHLNFISSINLLSMDEFSKIGNMNWITGRMSYGKTGASGSKIIIGRESSITNRHYIDCNSLIKIGKYTTIAGIRSQILTHSINFKNNLQELKNVLIGDYCFVGTSVILLPGASVPDKSIISAGSVVRSNLEYNGDNVNFSGILFSGNPAKFEKFFFGDYLYFVRKKGRVAMKS